MASIVRWVKRVEPKLKRNKAPTKIDRQALAQDVQAHPDAYQYERAQRFGVSQRGIGYALHSLKISYKKTLKHPRADEKARTHFQQLLTITLFDAYIDSDIFYAWTVHDLIPKLSVQAVVVMDNAAFHKRQDTQQALLQAGHTLAYLPPYSPDLNPIEHKWAQAKALRRKRQCDIDALFNHPSL